MSQKHDKERELFLQDMSDLDTVPPFGFCKKIGENMCWEYAFTGHKLRLALEETTEIKQGFSVEQLLAALPSVLAALVPGVLMGLIAQVVQLTVRFSIPDGSTVFRTWTHVICGLRIFALHPSLPGSDKTAFVIERLGQSALKYVIPSPIKHWEVCDLVGSTISLGNGSSRRWKIYIAALGVAMRKIKLGGEHR
jgi:hypothetical protein